MSRLAFLSVAVSVASILLASACNGSSRRAPGRTEGMNAGECSDGADNDGDRLYDCGDPDCAAAPACAGVVPDGGFPDGSIPDGTTMPDTAVPPRDSAPDTRPDATGGVCDDVSGPWENVMECAFAGSMGGEIFSIVYLGDCRFSFTSDGISGTGTLSGSMVTIDVTEPVPVTCTGTYSTGVIRTDCLGCVLELHQL